MDDPCLCSSSRHSTRAARRFCSSCRVIKHAIPLHIASACFALPRALSSPTSDAWSLYLPSTPFQPITYISCISLLILKRQGLLSSCTSHYYSSISFVTATPSDHSESILYLAELLKQTQQECSSFSCFHLLPRRLLLWWSCLFGSR